MPSCGATFDENSVPPLDKGGLQGGFREQKPTHPGASVKVSQAFTPSEGGDFRRSCMFMGQGGSDTLQAWVTSEGARAATDLTVRGHAATSGAAR
jgi:hypothetical protein